MNAVSGHGWRPVPFDAHHLEGGLNHGWWPVPCNAHHLVHHGLPDAHHRHVQQVVDGGHTVCGELSLRRAGGEGGREEGRKAYIQTGRQEGMQKERKRRVAGMGRRRGRERERKENKQGSREVGRRARGRGNRRLSLECNSKDTLTA